MAVTNRSQLANGTATQQGLYNQALARQAQLNNQQKYLQMAQASPMFALGNLIGNIMNDHYNSRGVNKEKQAISDALAGYQGGQDYNALNSILESPTILNATQNLSNGDSITVGNGYTPTVNTIPVQGGNAIPVQSENSIVAPSVQTQTQNLNSFDLDKFKSNYFEEARKRGRTDAQINEAWSTMQPQITELANKAKEARIDTAFSAMTPDEDGKYPFGEMSMANPNFVKYLRPLMKDSPELATLMIKGATAKDTANANLARQNSANAAKLALQQGNQQFQLGRDNVNNAIKLAIAKMKAGEKGKNSNTSGVDNQRYTNIRKALDKLELIEKGNGYTTQGRQLTPEEQQQKNILTRQANAYLYGGVLGQESGSTKTPANVQTSYKQPNINQYSQELVDDIGKGIAILSAKNYPKGQIIAIIKNMYKNQIAANGGGAGYIDQILQDVDWGETGYNVRG